MDNVPQLSKFLFAVKDEGKRKLVEEVLQAWQEKVVPFLPVLEKGQRHQNFHHPMEKYYPYIGFYLIFGGVKIPFLLYSKEQA